MYERRGDLRGVFAAILTPRRPDGLMDSETLEMKFRVVRAAGKRGLPGRSHRGVHMLLQAGATYGDTDGEEGPARGDVCDCGVRRRFACGQRASGE